MYIYIREQVNSYNELDAKLALKDYAVSQNKTKTNRTEDSEDSNHQSSASGPPRNGTEPEPQSSLTVTMAELPSQGEVKGKKVKSLKIHRNKLKSSEKDISESDYNNN